MRSGNDGQQDFDLFLEQALRREYQYIDDAGFSAATVARLPKWGRVSSAIAWAFFFLGMLAYVQLPFAELAEIIVQWIQALDWFSLTMLGACNALVMWGSLLVWWMSDFKS